MQLEHMTEQEINDMVDYYADKIPMLIPSIWKAHLLDEKKKQKIVKEFIEGRVKQCQQERQNNTTVKK